MKWILAVDALATSTGALAFGRWLHSASDAIEVQPVHVVEFEDGFLPGRVADSFREWSVDAARESLRELAPELPRLRVIEAMPPEAGLERASDELGADGLIIGRRAPVEGGTLVRLGPVARRLARRLHEPLMVVPRDYTPRLDADDPILLATDATESAAEAAATARTMSRILQRPLVVVMAVEDPRTVATYLTMDIWDEVRVAMHDAARERLDTWCERHGLGEAARRVVPGTPWGGLMGEIEKEGATMIVCGSRRMGTVDRLFVSSTASELASAAPVPVLIVPPADAAEQNVPEPAAATA